MSEKISKTSGFWGKLASLFKSQPKEQRIMLFLYPVARQSVETCSEEELKTMKGYVQDLAKLSLARRELHRFTLTISGYDDDPRELYEVPEVCSWARDTLEKIPHLPFFLDDPSTGRLVTWVLGPLPKAEVLTEGFGNKFKPKLLEVLVTSTMTAEMYFAGLGGSDDLVIALIAERGQGKVKLAA